MPSTTRVGSKTTTSPSRLVVVLGRGDLEPAGDELAAALPDRHRVVRVVLRRGDGDDQVELHRALLEPGPHLLAQPVAALESSLRAIARRGRGHQPVAHPRAVARQGEPLGRRGWGSTSPRRSSSVVPAPSPARWRPGRAPYAGLVARNFTSARRSRAISVRRTKSSGVRTGNRGIVWPRRSVDVPSGSTKETAIPRTDGASSFESGRPLACDQRTMHRDGAALEVPGPADGGGLGAGVEGAGVELALRVQDAVTRRRLHHSGEAVDRLFGGEHAPTVGLSRRSPVGTFGQNPTAGRGRRAAPSRIGEGQADSTVTDSGSLQPADPERRSRPRTPAPPRPRTPTAASPPGPGNPRTRRAAATSENVADRRAERGPRRWRRSSRAARRTTRSRSPRAGRRAAPAPPRRPRR